MSTRIDLGYIKGAKGDKGDKGDNGDSGIVIKADGGIEVGRYLDFHNDYPANSTDYTVRIAGWDKTGVLYVYDHLQCAGDINGNRVWGAVAN